MKNMLTPGEDSFSGNRIESLDILRGLAIISIVVMHRLYYNWPTDGISITCSPIR